MSVATKAKKNNAEAETTVWKTVHRVVFPNDGDTDTLPLYVDFNAAQRVVSVQEVEAKAGGSAGLARENQKPHAKNPRQLLARPHRG